MCVSGQVAGMTVDCVLLNADGPSRSELVCVSEAQHCSHDCVSGMGCHAESQAGLLEWHARLVQMWHRQGRERERESGAVGL